MSREVELRVRELWSGRRGCQVLPPAIAVAVFLAESLRRRAATVHVAETVGGLECGLWEDLLVAPTNVFVPASTGLLQQRKPSTLRDVHTRRQLQLRFPLTPAQHLLTPSGFLMFKCFAKKLHVWETPASQGAWSRHGDSHKQARNGGDAFITETVFLALAGP